jgi:hypothetical protein
MRKTRLGLGSFGSCLTAFLVALFLVPNALANGTETLGPTATAGGTGILVAGVGTETGQPQSFSFDVPGAVKQVFLYWTGHHSAPNVADDSIAVDGTAVSGTLIGGPTTFFNSMIWTTFRADITGLGLVTPGANTLTISGLDYVASDGFGNDGAGVPVVYDDGSTAATIGLRDGQDLAFDPDACCLHPVTELTTPELRQTAAQTFGFAPSPVSRTANLATLAASVEGPASGHGSIRPHRLEITFGLPGGAGDTVVLNPWGSTSGAEYDAVNTPVTIPAGAAQMTVRALSLPDADFPNALPASLAWTAAALSVPPPPRAPGTGTPGFWKNHPQAWPVDSIVIGGVTYTKAQAIAILKTSGGDKTLTMFAQLVSAKLNVLVGNESSCVAATITAADAWLTAFPLGSGVRGSSNAWKLGEPLKNTLDAYNNGELCAPHRG